MLEHIPFPKIFFILLIDLLNWELFIPPLKRGTNGIIG